jgi:hypothetical protein
MTVFTFHYAKTTVGSTARALFLPPTGQQVPGLKHTDGLSARQYFDIRAPFWKIMTDCPV